MKSGITYLAAPYSSPDPQVVAQRMDLVNAAQANLVRAGHCVVTPLSCHHIAAYLEGYDLTWDQWKKYAQTLLERSTNFVIVDIPGWQDSVGVQAELRLARSLGLDCYIYHPRQLQQI